MSCNGCPLWRLKDLQTENRFPPNLIHTRWRLHAHERARAHTHDSHWRCTVAVWVCDGDCWCCLRRLPAWPQTLPARCCSGLFFSSALRMYGHMTACDKIPPSLTPTCTAVCAAPNTQILAGDSCTASHRRPSLVDGDEEDTLAFNSTPAVCMRVWTDRPAADEYRLVI